MNEISYWQVHGILFIIFMFIFPRLTMFFTGIFFRFFGLWYFLGWLLAPRITVAVLASWYYFHTNPVLCVLTWIWALAGEGTEKSACSKAAH